MDWRDNKRIPIPEGTAHLLTRILELDIENSPLLACRGKLTPHEANVLIGYAKLLYLPTDQAIEQWEEIKPADEIATISALTKRMSVRRIDQQKYQFLKTGLYADTQTRLIALAKEVARARIQTQYSENRLG